MRPSFDDDPQSHPHTRGANWSVAVTQSASTESSPHTWGKSRVPSTCALRIGVIPTHVGQMKMGRTPGLELERVIPTHVGQINWLALLLRIRGSHPHTRGANVVGCISSVCGGESSPHTWGKYFFTGANGGQLSSFHSTLTRIILAAGQAIYPKPGTSNPSLSNRCFCTSERPDTHRKLCSFCPIAIFCPVAGSNACENLSIRAAPVADK